MKAQLLDLFNRQPSLDNFITTSNIMVIEALKSNKNQFTHIIGSRLSGKTHLLKAWVNDANLQHKSAAFIDAIAQEHQELRQLATYYQFVAIDNIDELSEDDQIDLFDLFNSIKLNNRDNQLLTSSQFGLENNHKIRDDLKTRILSGLNLQLKIPDDEEITQSLKIYAAQEGITIPNTELNYMINHHTRNIGNLINTINKVANTAVLEKRNITIPLIKQVLSNYK